MKRVRGSSLDPQTNTSVEDRGTQPHWHSLYSLFAIFNLVTIIVAVALNYFVSSLYEDTMVEVQQWEEQLNWYARLEQLPDAIYTPSQDVFVSHDVEEKSATMRNALREFNRQMDVTRDKVKILKEDLLLRYLEEIRMKTMAMAAEAELVFLHLTNNEMGKASEHSLALGREYNAIMDSFRQLTDHVHAIQSEHLTQHMAYAKRWKQIERGFIGFMMLLTIGAVVYVFRLSRQTEAVTQEKEQNLAALQQSEERLRRIATNLPHSMIYQYLLRPDGSVAYPYVGPNCHALFEVEAEALMRTPTLLIDLIHPDDRPALFQSIAESARTLSPWQWKSRFLMPSGTLKWFQGASIPEKQANGDILWDGLMTDITVSKKIEEALAERMHLAALRADVGVALTRSETLRGGLQSSAEAMVRHLDAAFARIWTLNDAQQVLELQASAGLYTHLDGSHGRVAVGQFKIGLIAQERIPHLTNTVIGDPRVGDQEWAKREGMVAFAGYPLIVEERLVGIMAMFARHPLADFTLEALASMANELALGIERKRADEAELCHLAERKRVEDALRESESRYRQIFDNAYDLIVSFNAEGIYTSANASHKQILGWSPEDLIGYHYSKITTPASVAFIEDRQRRSRAGETVSPTYEVEVIRKDGYIVPLEARTRLIRNANGQPIELMGVFRDITARRQMETELRQAKDVAEAASQAKSEFLATMSHEIRTPMNGVLGMAGLLLDTDLTPRQREFATILKQSGDALLSIINDILDFSKIEAGKLELELLDFDLRTAIEETLELFAPKAQEKGLELAYLLYGGAPTAVRGDPGRLRQILLNLLGNALKFTERGEVILRITSMQTSATHALLRFTISDTGIGIPPERLGRLFHAFSQADSSTTRKHGGTGLGLAISKRLVELMGGEIGVESTLHQGSTFWFTVQFEIQPAQTQEAWLRPRVELRGRRVLVVDDNATNRTVLHHYFAAWGLASESVVDGPQGLACLRAAVAEGRPYDLAILDYQMPGMDGLELAQTIRADQRLASLKLVLLTSVVQRGEMEQARQAGIDAYLTKPIRPTQLSDCLALMLGQASVPELKAPAALVTEHTVAALQNGQRPLVLVAEDNTFNQKLAVWLLEKLGYRADVAANGQEAVAAVSRIPYVAVFMDCQMPEMDGFEATSLIRQHEATAGGKRHTRIIAMTANAIQGDRERCLAVGMDDYLSKPITPEALSAALGRWVVEEEEAEATTLMAQTSQEVEELVRRVGGDQQLLLQVAELFAVEYPPMAAAVRAAVVRQDAEELQRAAHTLKGAVGNLAAQGAYEAAQVLEQLGRKGTVVGGEAALSRLDAEVTRFQHTLKTRVR